MSERHDHGENFSGKDGIKLCGKSLISQVYDLLARHNYEVLSLLGAGGMGDPGGNVIGLYQHPA
jgi:hypothetical protein